MANNGTVIVTGANGGIGRSLTLSLAQQGVRLVMACRNREKAEAIQRQIIAESGNPAVELLPLDLASIASVRAFADTLKNRDERISVLLNNAGTMNGTFRLSENGLEQTMGVNYVGTAALTLALLPLMDRGSRIVNTASCTWRLGRPGENPFKPDPAHYSRFRAYGTSKLALMLFTLELSARLETREIGVFAADPGVVDTGIITMHRWFDPLADRLFRPLIRTPEQGAHTALWLASGADIYGGENKFRNDPSALSESIGAGDLEIRKSNPKQQNPATYISKNTNVPVFFGGKCNPLPVPRKLARHPWRSRLWNETERLLASFPDYGA